MPTFLPAILSWFHMSVEPRSSPDRETWLRDPLSHPTIAVMNLDEVADLPAAELRARVRS